MTDIIQQLENNKRTYLYFLKDVEEELILWKPIKDKWCLLEVVCHLYDEERDDFRFRVNWALDKPGKVPPAINPLDWIEAHHYMAQDFNTMLDKFIEEREQSISWLKSLKNPAWTNSFEHPKLGELSAAYFLTNWLAHDYLHIRQILKIKFDYLEGKSGNNLNYAGSW